MKILKFLTLALIFSGATQSCTQNEAAAPNYEVANCGVIKDPLKDIPWIASLVQEAIATKRQQKIVQYDHSSGKVYYTEKNIQYSYFILTINNCTGKTLGTNFGIAGATEDFTKIMKEVKNPVILFEQK